MQEQFETVVAVVFLVALFVSGLVIGGAVGHGMGKVSSDVKYRLSHYDIRTGDRILDSVEVRGDTLIIHRRSK